LGWRYLNDSRSIIKDINADKPVLGYRIALDDGLSARITNTAAANVLQVQSARAAKVTAELRGVFVASFVAAALHQQLTPALITAEVLTKNKSICVIACGARGNFSMHPGLRTILVSFHA
jgi:hypothetical protein